MRFGGSNSEAVSFGAGLGLGCHLQHLVIGLSARNLATQHLNINIVIFPRQENSFN